MDFKDATPGQTYPVKTEIAPGAMDELTSKLHLLTLGSIGDYEHAITACVAAAAYLLSDMHPNNLSLVACQLEAVTAHFTQSLRERQTLINMPIKDVTAH